VVPWPAKRTAKYLDGLKTLWQRGELDLPPELAPLDERGWARWLRRLRKHSWVVYDKASFAGPEKLLDYPSRYTHRVAISNERIQSCVGGQVCFRYRDRRDGNRCKLERLPAAEFISRFLRHVLPDRFTRIRHYGFLAGRNKRRSLARIRQLLGAPSPIVEPPQTAQQWLVEVLGIDPSRCPCCGQRLFEESLRPIRDMPPRESQHRCFVFSARAPP
jgi:hypothetical protein